MTLSNMFQSRFVELARALAPQLRERASEHDVEGSFVHDSYALLKEHKLLSALVPAELGGGGATHREMCAMLCELAKSCSSTALALSMHTHLVAATVFRHRNGQPGEALLRKVAAGELVLVSTGAGDWLESCGKSERVSGGYRVSGVKRFASGCPVGDLMITSAPYDGAEGGPEVLHFALPLRTEGVKIREDWDTLGMRATGSHSVELDEVFIADESISMRRPRGKWHPSWNVIVTVASPLYMAPYVGVAERAAEIALETAKRREPDPQLVQSVGELQNLSVMAGMAFRELTENAADLDFKPSTERANQALIRKTILTNAVIGTVQKALEVMGGSGLYRRNGLERLLRDIQGAPFHPLPEKKQLTFSGRVALGLDPVG